MKSRYNVLNSEDRFYVFEMGPGRPRCVAVFYDRGCLNRWLRITKHDGEQPATGREHPNGYYGPNAESVYRVLNSRVNGSNEIDIRSCELAELARIPVGSVSGATKQLVERGQVIVLRRGTLLLPARYKVLPRPADHKLLPSPWEDRPNGQD